jgi:hypothetical protein
MRLSCQLTGPPFTGAGPVSAGGSVRLSETDAKGVQFTVSAGVAVAQTRLGKCELRPVVFSGAKEQAVA